MASLLGDEHRGAAARFAGPGIPIRLVFEGGHLEDRPVGVPARAGREARLARRPTRTPR